MRGWGRGGRAACVPAPARALQVPAGGAGRGGGVAGCCLLTRAERWPRSGKWSLGRRVKRSGTEAGTCCGLVPILLACCGRGRSRRDLVLSASTFPNLRKSGR